MSDEVNWRRYLAEFHRDRAGIAEAVLSRALAGDHSPYRWLARAVSATATTVVDLACGSGPMSRELARPGRLGGRPGSVGARARFGSRARTWALGQSRCPATSLQGRKR